MTKTLIAVVSDTHINSTVGLSSPTAIKDDETTYRASKGQRWMYYNWLNYWGIIDSKEADKKIAILDGDILDYPYKYKSNQIVAHNKSIIISNAIDVLMPMIEAVDELYVISGTPAHVGIGAELECLLANDITITVFPPDAVIIENEDTRRAEPAIWKYLEVECEGVRIFAAHHTTMGRLPWTFANSANKNAVKAELYYSRIGKKAPHLVFFGHNHLFAQSGRGNFPVHAFHLPAWQLPTEYANKDTLSLADIGGLWVECENGDYEWGEKRYIPRTRGIWHKI